MAKYPPFIVLKSLIPKFVHSEYGRTKFKIICDDIGLANLMVRSRQDLTVIDVADLEWPCIGPTQLFGSAPWWLLMDRPTNQAWDCCNGEPTRIVARYFRYLDMFKRILENEEAETPGNEDLRPYSCTEPHSIIHPSSSVLTSQSATLGAYEPFPTQFHSQIPKQQYSVVATYL